jgi:hypothetical protein
VCNCDKTERESSDVAKTCGACLDSLLLQKLRQEDFRLKDFLGFKVSSSKVNLENVSRPGKKKKKKKKIEWGAGEKERMNISWIKWSMPITQHWEVETNRSGVQGQPVLQVLIPRNSQRATTTKREATGSEGK